jgi:pantoate--beta-alanine ligase
MQIIRTIAEMQQFSMNCRREGQTIGFVPTMGFLHQGHLSLVDQAKSKSDIVVLSIFVNPTQFGPNEDLDAYPRDFARDESLCENHGVSAVFYPPVEQMYADNFSTWVKETALTNTLCGQSRPGHFKGVTTVVTKLFNAVLPDIAVFGQKDAQQAMVLKRMVRDLNFPIRMIIAPIVREPDGLAMSSRNKYLSDDERQCALSISRSIFSAGELFKNGETSAGALIDSIRTEIEKHSGRVDYVKAVSQETLQEVEMLDVPSLIAVAAFFGSTRLIDNIFLG